MNPKIILLVEDNPDDQKLTLRALKKNNILNEIIVVNDGVEALDFLFGTGTFSGRDINHKPALVLLDLKLPRLDGLEVLKRIRKNPLTRSLPVVILTSSKEQQDLMIIYDLIVNSYIRKPVDFIQFNEAIKTIGLYWMVLNELPPDE